MRLEKYIFSLVVVAVAGLAGCSSSRSHLAFVSLPEADSRGAFGIGVFRIDNGSGKFTFSVASPFLTGNSPGPIAVLPSNQFLYVANRTDNTISSFKIDSQIGSLTEVTPRKATGLSPNSMVMDSGGKYLFTANQVSSDISVFSIDSSTGALTEASGSPFPTARNPVSIAVNPAGTFVYVVNSDLELVFGYAVGAAGALQPVPGTQFTVGAGAFGIQVDPSGKFLYVANSTDNTVSIFTIASSGALTPVIGSPFNTGTSPIAIAVSGQYLYIANHGSNNITAYSIDADTGVPTALTGSPFSANTMPVSLVPDPNGTVLYELGQDSPTISTLKITSSTGVLTSGTVNATAPSTPVAIFVTK